jgi:hypothetical protein
MLILGTATENSVRAFYLPWDRPIDLIHFMPMMIVRKNYDPISHVTVLLVPVSIQDVAFYSDRKHTDFRGEF